MKIVEERKSRALELLSYSTKIRDRSVLRNSEYRIFKKYKIKTKFWKRNESKTTKSEITLYKVFVLTRVPC